MFLAVAVLLIHPQLVSAASLPAEKAAIDRSATISALTRTPGVDPSLATIASSYHAEAEPVPESSATLPDPPVAIASPAPIALVRPGKSLTVSVAELRSENRQKEFMWRGLVLATSGAATFDAWSTRHAITSAGAVELNPLLKPFAGNGSLYAAIQVGPAILDFAGKKMMYSRYSWVRRMWWVPQTAGFISSMFCGSHNLAYH